MTMDERLEKLVERHEALTQSVEIVSHDIASLRESMKDIRELTSTLVRVILLHEERLDRLEGNSAA